MDAVTYPEKKVVDFIDTYLIPLRLTLGQESLQDKYQTFWTPTTVILDRDGNELQREIGFFEPQELIAVLHLGLAKVHLDAGEHDTAEVHLKKLLEDFADTTSVAEAVFFRGVNGYKSEDDPGKLKEAYEILQEKHAGSRWAKRAAPYRLI